MFFAEAVACSSVRLGAGVAETILDETRGDRDLVSRATAELDRLRDRLGGELNAASLDKFIETAKQHAAEQIALAAALDRRLDTAELPDDCREDLRGSPRAIAAAAAREYSIATMAEAALSRWEER